MHSLFQIAIVIQVTLQGTEGMDAGTTGQLKNIEGFLRLVNGSCQVNRLPLENK